MTGNERIISQFSELLAAKEKREQRRISQRTLEKEVGLSRSTVQVWMNNTPTRFDSHALLAFCRYFDCDLSDLLKINNNEVQAHG